MKISFKWLCELVDAPLDADEVARRLTLAGLEVETEDFVWLTQEFLTIADRHAKGRVVSVLEGGYDLRALAESVATHVRTLMRG